MKVQIRVFEKGKTFEGEAVLLQVGSHAALPGKQVDRASKGRATKPSDAVDALYKKSFFASERTLRDTIGQLGKDGYNFSSPSVLMALQSREYLQRRGSKGSYRFVQKYPPS